MELFVWALAILAVADAARVFVPRLPVWSGWAISLVVGVSVALFYGADPVVGVAAAGLSALLRSLGNTVAALGDFLAVRSLRDRLGRR